MLIMSVPGRVRRVPAAGSDRAGCIGTRHLSKRRELLPTPSTAASRFDDLFTKSTAVRFNLHRRPPPAVQSKRIVYGIISRQPNRPTVDSYAAYNPIYYDAKRLII